MKRHNMALETLQSAKEKFYENEVRQHDRIQQLRQQLADANHDIDDTNKALDMLSKVRTVTFQGNQYNREPVVSDFYTASDEMNDYQYVTMGALGLGVGYVVYKLT